MNFLFNINVCRVCMQNEQSSDLCKNKDLLEKFIFTTRLVVSENDNLPKVICANCTARLKIAHKFIKTAHESENNLKTFLSKISTEFKEVTQSSKSNSNEGKNLTEEEVLALVENDEDETCHTPPTKATTKSKDNTNTAGNTSAKRKLSPVRECVQKKSKSGLENRNSTKTIREDVPPKKSKSGLKNVNSKTTIEVNTSKDALGVNELETIKQEKNGFDFNEDIALIDAADYREIPSEEDTICLENQTQNDNDDAEHHQEHEGEADDHEVLAEHVSETEEEEDEEQYDKLENSQTDVTNLNVNEESQTQSETTEVAVENSQGTINGVKSVETDGYLREYESMLNTPIDTIQYHTDYIDENSVEEVTLKDGSIFIQSLEQEELHDGIVDVDDDDDDNDDGDNCNVEGDDDVDNEVEKSEISALNDQKDFSPTATFTKKQTKMRRFYCEQCNRDFSTKTNLNRHMQSHEGNKPFPCTECDKSFTQKSSLKQHMYTHTGERPHVCEICNRGFTQCKSLIFHMRRHTGQKPFQCEYCLIQFRQKDALRIHIVKHHVTIDQMSDGSEIYTCIICQKEFNTKSKFKTHTKAHTAISDTDTAGIMLGAYQFASGSSLPVRKARNQNTDVIYLNPYENLINVSASSAADPSRAKTFQCRRCFKCFALKKSLIRHMHIHSPNRDDDLTECVECDLQFSNAADLQEHLMERHQYACSGCPELIFKTMQDLKMHMLEHDFEQQEEQE